MLKKGLLLTIIFLLIFSIGAFATDYKYTQESGAGFFVGTADKADALEDSNELRQIINDLGALLVHSKMDGLYPKDLTTGGTIQIPEAGLKFSDAPANDDIAAYIAGEMTWQTLAELSIQPLDTALTNISALTYVSPSLIKLTADDTYAVRTLVEVKEDLSLNYVENLKVKLDGTAAPGVSNDNTEGYAVGSRWIDVTNDKEYVALDVSTGAAVWTETTQLGSGGTFTELTDTPANYTGSSLKHVRVNVGETALEFVTLGGGGDMLKATYDTDEDGDVDVAAGGTEKSAWTLYAIPYLSGTTAFGEIAIGTAEYALTVNAGANGYDWTLFDLSLYYLKTEIDTQGEVETIWGDALMNDLIDDTTPEYGGPMDHNNERDTEVKTVEFNGLYDNGNSGATPTINWQNGNYQKIAISENALLTFSNAFIGTITLVMTYSGAYTLGFNAGYTVLEEGGTELSFTETLNAVDILKVMYLGTANNYVVGVMLDVKD